MIKQNVESLCMGFLVCFPPILSVPIFLAIIHVGIADLNIMFYFES